MSHQRLRGIFTPNLVPCRRRRRINEPELRRYVDWLIDRGVHGLYPNGSTGEFTRFTAEERRRIADIVARQANGRVPILAGAAEANVRETIKACEYYHGLGVRAVAIVSPFYYKLSPASVYAYFKEIGRQHADRRHAVQHPDVRQPDRRADGAAAGRGVPERIVAIKDSSGDIPHMIRMIQAVRPNRPDFSFLTGWDAALMPMLLDRLRRRHERHQRRRPRADPQALRPDARRPARRSPRAAVRPGDAVRRDALPGGVPRRLPGRGEPARL